jgi:hypothetical protein
VHSVGVAEQGDVDVVVDDEERLGPSRDFADPAREPKQLTTSQGLVAKLNDVRSPAYRRGRQLNDPVGRRVRCDDVKVSGEEPL